MSLMEPVTDVPQDRWDQAIRRHDRFRGEFIRHYARGETLISETVLFHHQNSPAGCEVPLPGLPGQRLAALQEVVLARVATDGHAAVALRALAGFKSFERERAFLCHGNAVVTIDAQGQWCVGYKLLNFRADKPEGTSMFLMQGDADALLMALAAATAKLASALGQIRKPAVHTGK